MEKPHWMYHGCLSSATLPSLRLCVCCILHMPEQGCCSSDALIRCEQGLCEGRRVRTNAPCFLWCPPNVLQARRKGAKRSHFSMPYPPNANQGSVLRCLVGILFVQDVQSSPSRLETINQTRHHHTHVRKASNPKIGCSI